MNPHAETSALTVTSDGLELTGRGARRIRWADVERISAGRRPTPTDDQLSLRFELRGGDSFEVAEDVAGFTQLPVLLPELLPGFPESSEWLFDVDEDAPSEDQVLYHSPGSQVPGFGR